jgi:DnaJ-class molecular chaperone
MAEQIRIKYETQTMEQAVRIVHKAMSGRKPWEPWQCANCSGTGSLEIRGESKPCWFCNGTGKPRISGVEVIE